MNIKIKFPNKKNDVEIQTSKEPINKDFFSPILSLLISLLEFQK